MPRTLRRLLIAAAVPALALALAAPVAAADEDVSIVDFDFTPGSVTVTVGDTVTWTNNGEAPHDVTFSEDVKSEILANGETYDRTFESEGTFDYICSIHPQMTGTVVVEAAAAEPTEAPTEEPATDAPETEEPATEEPGATQGPPETATETGRGVPGSLPAVLAGLLLIAGGVVVATRQAVSRR